MTETRRVAFVLAAFALGVPATSMAAEAEAVPDLRGAQIYSSLCVEPESGDIGGVRLYVRKPGQSPRVLLNLSEGGLEGPFPTVVKTQTGGVLSFTYAGAAPVVSYSGQIFKTYALVKSGEKGAETQRVPLSRDQKTFPPCRTAKPR